MPYPKPSHPDYCPGSGGSQVTKGDACPYCGRHIARRKPRPNGAPGPRHPHRRTVPRSQRFTEWMRADAAERPPCPHLHQTSVPGAWPLVIVCTDCYATIPERDPR